MNNTKIKVIGVLREENINMQNLANIIHCRRRLEWTRDWLKKNQNEFTAKENLLKEIQFRSNETYHLNCFLDITEKQFRYLISKLGPLITKHEPHRKKKFFSAEERLAITLKYLATGEFHSCRNYGFRASKPVILKMIGDICLNIYDTLKDEFISTPKTENDWREISSEFEKKNQIPNCLGSLGMKHMVFNKSSNVKQKCRYDPNDTMILTAIVDSSDNFIYIDIGQKSFEKDQFIFENSTIKHAIEQNQLNLPAITNNGQSSYYFVGNGTLPLKSYLMKTLNAGFKAETTTTTAPIWYKFGSREYEYCYAVESIELKTKYAFRMLTNIFPVLSLPFGIDGENAKNIALGCVALYNFLRKTDRLFYENSEKIKSEEEEIIDDVRKTTNHDDEESGGPCIYLSDCFKQLSKQLGDEDSAETERNYLMDYIFDRRHERYINLN